MSSLRSQPEFLKDVLNQSGQCETFHFRLDHPVLQPGQFKQLLRQAPDLAALTECNFKIAAAVSIPQRISLDQQGFKIAMQGSERCRQIMRYVGKQFSSLLLLIRQFVPLLGDTLGHHRKRLGQCRNG